MSSDQRRASAMVVLSGLSLAAMAWYAAVVASVPMLGSIVAGLILAGSTLNALRAQRTARKYPGKPWMTRQDWASRRVVSGNGPWTTVLFSLLVLTVFAVLAAVAWLIGSALGAPTSGAIVGVVILAAAIDTIVRRVRSHGTPWSVVKLSCRLDTLPGVIGGWFKGQIDAELPAPPQSASVRLTFLEGDSESVQGIWSVSYELAASDFTRLGGCRFRFPVRFQIPARLAGFEDNPRWTLSTSVRLAGGASHSGSFAVPIYQTHEGSGKEQQAEEPFDVVEDTGSQDSWLRRQSVRRL